MRDYRDHAMTISHSVEWLAVEKGNCTDASSRQHHTLLCIDVPLVLNGVRCTSAASKETPKKKKLFASKMYCWCGWTLNKPCMYIETVRLTSIAATTTVAAPHTLTLVCSSWELLLSAASSQLSDVCSCRLEIFVYLVIHWNKDRNSVSSHARKCDAGGFEKLARYWLRTHGFQ